MTFVIDAKKAKKMVEAKQFNPEFEEVKDFGRETEKLMDKILDCYKKLGMLDYLWTNRKKESYRIDFIVWDRSGKGKPVYNIFTGEYVESYEIDVEWKDKDGKGVDNSKRMYETVDRDAENPIGGLNWLRRKVDKYGRLPEGKETYYAIFEGDRNGKYYRVFICTMYYLYEEVKIITSNRHEENLRPWDNRIQRSKNMDKKEFMRYCYLEDCQWIWDSVEHLLKKVEGLLK